MNPSDRKCVFQRVISTNWTLGSLGMQDEQSDQHMHPEQQDPSGVAECCHDKIPQYTRKYLATQHLPELREICKRWGIRAPTRKEDIITNILTRVSVIHRQLSEIDEISRNLKTRWFRGEGPLHTFYAEHFNWVDLADRYWNTVEDHHHYNDWKFKYLMLLLRFGVYDAMVLSGHIHGETWKNFRVTAAMQLINQ